MRHYGHSGEREALRGLARPRCLPQKLGLGSMRRVRVLAHGRNGSGCEIGGGESILGCACLSGRFEPSLQRGPPSGKLQRVSEKGGKGSAPRAVWGEQMEAKWGRAIQGGRDGRMVGGAAGSQGTCCDRDRARRERGRGTGCTCGPKKVCGSSAVQRLVRLRGGPGGPGHPSSSNPSLNAPATAAGTAAVHLP